MNRKAHTLDDEEKNLQASVERGEWKRVSDLPKEKKRYEKIAKHTLNKIKRVNLRLSEKDYNAAKIKAVEEGLPYQTLLASVIHKYLNGMLVSR